MNTKRILATLIMGLAVGASGAAFAQAGGNGNGGGGGGSGNAHGAATAGPTSDGDPVSGPTSPRPKKVMKHKSSSSKSGGASSSQPAGTNGG